VKETRGGQFDVLCFFTFEEQKEEEQEKEQKEEQKEEHRTTQPSAPSEAVRKPIRFLRVSIISTSAAHSNAIHYFNSLSKDDDDHLHPVGIQKRGCFSHHERQEKFLFNASWSREISLDRQHGINQRISKSTAHSNAIHYFNSLSKDDDDHLHPV
jgi:hypothetical protein